jgi:hypothetical protein
MIECIISLRVLMTFMKEFNSKTDILIDFLRKKADGKTEIRLTDEINHTTLDIIASVSLLHYFLIFQKKK